MFCTECGNKVNKNDKFCSKCGNKLNQDTENSTNQFLPTKNVCFDQNKTIELDDGYYTWFDESTNLTWEIKNSKNIEVSYENYEDAIKYIEMLNNTKYAGYSDWRLPSKYELSTLIDIKRELYFYAQDYDGDSCYSEHYEIVKPLRKNFSKSDLELKNTLKQIYKKEIVNDDFYNHLDNLSKYINNSMYFDYFYCINKDEFIGSTGYEENFSRKTVFYDTRYFDSFNIKVRAVRGTNWKLNLVHQLNPWLYQYMPSLKKDLTDKFNTNIIDLDDDKDFHLFDPIHSNTNSSKIYQQYINNSISNLLEHKELILSTCLETGHTLDKIPTEIGYLTQLTALGIDGLEISPNSKPKNANNPNGIVYNLPNSIYSLINLEALLLIYFTIESLSNEVCNLIKLKELELTINTSLSTEQEAWLKTLKSNGCKINVHCFESGITYE